MKKSELKQIIKEEIQNILQEEDPLQAAFNKKVGTSEPSGAKNVMRSKEWMEGYRAYLPGKSTYAQPKNPYIEGPGSYAERNAKMLQWSEGFKAAYDKDSKPFTPEPPTAGEMEAYSKMIRDLSQNKSISR